MPGESVNPSTDPPVAADLIDSVYYQRLKLKLGADGVATADLAGRDIGSGDGAAFVETPAYTAPLVGEFAPGTSAAQFPSKAGRLARLKARAANAGKVYVGVSGVTKADGTTDTTTGLELQAGDDTGWIPVDNLNRFYGIGDNSADSVTYMVLA